MTLFFLYIIQLFKKMKKYTIHYVFLQFQARLICKNNSLLLNLIHLQNF